MVREPDSPPISPKTVRQGKRSRQSSRGELSVEELSNDDIGYDGDVEVVRPDQVEEPDSDFEDEADSLGPKKLLWPDPDEELVRGMKKLSWHPNKHRQHTLKGLEGRPPTPVGDEAVKVNKHGKRTEFEVEMLEGHTSAPPPKRRKRKDSPSSNVAQHIMASNRRKDQTDTSGRDENGKTSLFGTSDSAGPRDREVSLAEGDEMQLD